MTVPTLRSIFDAHKRFGSDKWTSYFDTYDEHFGSYRDKAISLLEIGVLNGGSLEIWGKYFPNATSLLGCDIDEKCRALSFEDPRIAVFVGDANSEATHQEIVKNTAAFDIIIDDGSHVVEDVLRSFSLYFPKLKSGGLYVIEDLHTSYWPKWGGGTDLTLSSMGFLKLLADVVNKEFWRDDRAQFNLLEPFATRYGLAVDDATLAIDEISFSNSVCVIRKGKDGFENRRHVTGTEFRVQDYNWLIPLSGTRELVEQLDVSGRRVQATEMQREFAAILPKALEIEAEAAQLRKRLATMEAELKVPSRKIKRCCRAYRGA
ncbi:class I SAM-dependent methyltransferase [Rhizobium beringeri]